MTYLNRNMKRRNEINDELSGKLLISDLHQYLKVRDFSFKNLEIGQTAGHDISPEQFVDIMAYVEITREYSRDFYCQCIQKDVTTYRVLGYLNEYEINFAKCCEIVNFEVM